MKSEIFVHSSGGVIISRTSGGIKYLAVFQELESGECQWVSPKGRLESGETALEAAVREIHEEIGLNNLTFISYLGEEKYNFSMNDVMHHKKVNWHLFEATKPHEVLLNKEEGFKKFSWLTYEECLKTFSHKQFIELIKVASTILSNKPPIA